MNAISVERAGVSHRTFSLGEGENFIVAEEVRLHGPVGRVHIRGTDYLTDYFFLTSGGRISVAENPNAIEQAEAFYFSTSSTYFPITTVETLLSNITAVRLLSHHPEHSNQVKTPLSGTLYVNPSIAMSSSPSTENSFTPTDDILVLMFSNTEKGMAPQATKTQYVEGNVLTNGSYRLTVRIGQMDKPYKLNLPPFLIMNPIASHYIPSPTPVVTKPHRRFIPSVKGSGSGQPEAGSDNERTDADIAMAAYFYPRGNSHPETYAETDILFIQRSGPAESVGVTGELNRPNEEKAPAGAMTVEFTTFAMYAVVKAAMKTRSENQNTTPKKKVSRETARADMRDTVAHLKGYQAILAGFSDETKDYSLVNPKDIGHMVNYTRLLLQLRSNYIPGGKPADKQLINNVDEALFYSRIITIWFLQHLESEALVTSGGLEGSDVLPAQLLAELCNGLQPNHPKLKILKYDEDQIQDLLHISCSRILKLVVDLSFTYRNKKPEFTQAVANAWQDLRRVISFLEQDKIFELGMITSEAWATKYELSCIAVEMGDIDTLLLLMQLTSKQLTASGHEHFFEIQRLFNAIMNILVCTLKQMDLPSANFDTFLNSASLLKLDTSQLKAAIKKHQQNRDHALTEKSEKINQKADAWAEEEKRRSDKIRQKMQNKKEEAQALRKKRHQAAKQHGKKTEPHCPELSTATTSDLSSEKSTIEPDNCLSFYEQGEQAFTEERYDDALEHYLKALSMTSDPLQKARIISSVADCYFFQGNFASRLRNQLAKAYDYYEDAERAFQSESYPELDKDGFFKLARSIIDAIDDKLIESIKQAYRWHVEAIDELQKLKGEEKEGNSEVEELLSLLIMEAEDQEELARSIKSGVITLNEASELRRQAINNKKPDQMQPQRKEEKKVLEQLSHLQEKVTNQSIKGKRKGKKKRQATQKESSGKTLPTLTIETELQRLKSGEAVCQKELYDALDKFSENAERAREIKRTWDKKTQRSESLASGAPAAGASKPSTPPGENHNLNQNQLNALLYSSGIRGYEAVNVPYNNWCMFEALERWLNLLTEHDNAVNNPDSGFELFYRMAHRAKLMADYSPDDQELNQIAATFLVDGPGRQAWGTTEILHRLIAPVLRLNILVLAVDFTEGHPILTSAIYTSDTITPVQPEERNSAINRPNTITLLHISNHWQAVLPVAGLVQPASTGSNATEPTENEPILPVGGLGIQGLEISTPEIPASQSQ